MLVLTSLLVTLSFKSSSLNFSLVSTALLNISIFTSFAKYLSSLSLALNVMTLLESIFPSLNSSKSLPLSLVITGSIPSLPTNAEPLTYSSLLSNLSLILTSFNVTFLLLTVKVYVISWVL